ncbi:MAG: Proton/sodium-glutamate symport protein [Candidatus Anoxychlamydiales bacterium]|nr:Proton/sodium-glutamate symport protein [Candidatus Anoxychlamydiales bacterium]NGX36211.1 Proton/sodium-glutamate symport protein [Candidatus Anoxychlamydiales bacterium]
MKSWVKILIGLFIGIAVGLIMRENAKIFQVFGDIFIRLLTMLVILIIFSSIVVGICHIHNPKKLGRIGFRTIAFYIITTIIAISIGLILAHFIKPGQGLEKLRMDLKPANALTLKDLLLSLVPSNPFKAFADGNILQVIIFSLLFGVAILFAKEKGKPILHLLESITHVMHKLTHFVMMLAPYGVFALMAATIGKIGVAALVPLFKFLLCNYIACLIQLLVVFSLALRYLAKVKIAPFFKGMKDAIVVAFTTSSSAATLPVTLECTQKHLGISEDVSGFVLSLGSTINMNGGAIGQAISAMFIAQAYGISLGPVQIIMLMLVSLFSAIGAPGVPGTGLIMLSLVLNVMGLPLEGISLVIGVDRLREMMSSVVNVMGDAVAAVYVAKKEGEINEKTYHKATWLDSDI